MRIAINGFGRIGRSFLRVLLVDPKVQKKLNVVAINLGPGGVSDLVYTFTYDTVMGKYDGDVVFDNGILLVGDYRIKIFTERDASNLPWEDLEVDWVVDCSGRYTQRERAEKHLSAGANKVLISAPANNPDISIIPGVNDENYEKSYKIVSLGSCTTNALMPLLKIVYKNFGIDSAMAVTTHAYTNSQVLLDSVVIGSDCRRQRSAAVNIIPTTSGASKMIAGVIPELVGKVSVSALRVPVANISLIDLTWTSPREILQSELGAAFETAQDEMHGIFSLTNEKLVSSDYYGDSHSVVLDKNLTVLHGKMGKVCGWYDNEWGYSSRLKDFLLLA